jgi:uncharacterized membrane protein YphA (DoxX/SURF4 family)
MDGGTNRLRDRWATVLLELELWRMLDIFGAAVSLLAFVLFWNGLKTKPTNWIIGPIVAVVTLVALLVANWPPDQPIFG